MVFVRTSLKLCVLFLIKLVFLYAFISMDTGFSVFLLSYIVTVYLVVQIIPLLANESPFKLASVSL